ncbi:hypothetical protein HAX54_028803, partial [Datura stramonium]|nr:hypothetical protein [Datura stramonium]
MVYCPLKKDRINWADGFLNYMIENCQDTRGNNSLPYGMLISRILKVIDIDLSKYPAKEILSTYDNRAFANTSYMFSKGKWHKKARFKLKLKTAVEESPYEVDSSDAPKFSMKSLLKDALKIKASFRAVVDDLHNIQASLSQVASATTNIGMELVKIRSQLTLLQNEGVKSFNLVLKQVDSSSARAELSNNELLQTFKPYESPQDIQALANRGVRIDHTVLGRLLAVCWYNRLSLDKSKLANMKIPILLDYKIEYT